MMQRLRKHAASTIVLLLLGVIGCSRSSYEIAEVDGQLLINGRPGPKIHIEFIPDAGVVGPRSVADTDADGRFALQTIDRDGSTFAGAVVGNHKVTLSDIQLSESATGKGVPIRFGQEYTLSNSTPLTHEVKSGKQTITLRVP